MRDIVTIFATLGQRLATLGTTPEGESLIAQAIAQNGWFTRADILRSVDAIREEMLSEASLNRWLSAYRPSTTPQRVAIVMAGNIPLVGFFDLLCTLCSGHKAYIKPSSKDSVLMNYIIRTLKEIDPTISIFAYDPTEHYDLAIATGSNEANNYFRTHFQGTRCLLRGSRHSVAVLDGKESEAELQGLITDITAYSGLGCRSVSMLFAPQGMEIVLPHTTALNPKLRGNIASRRALYTIQHRAFSDCGAFLLSQGSAFPTTLAEVTLQRYDNLSDVATWLQAQRDGIQCVVTHTDLPNAIPFGRAQYPTLTDYADGVDTMLFLGNEPNRV